jgi:hypothetical protein
VVNQLSAQDILLKIKELSVKKQGIDKPLGCQRCGIILFFLREFNNKFLS